jgi:site-specific recombinase XerD
MENAIQTLKKHLTNLNYSQRTVHTYATVVERLCKHCNKQPHQITPDDFKSFIDYLVADLKLSWNTIHNYLCSIRYFYKEIMKQCEVVEYVRYPKRVKKLPVVMSYTEVRQIFNHVKNFKHNTILKLFYSTGIRLKELRNITLDCIDLERRTIFIRAGKGQKDRYVALSHVMREQLIEYLERFKPEFYLFETNQKKAMYSSAGIRFIITHARNQLNFKKRISIHCFRHSFATHMLEQGGNILVLQRLLGHTHLNATLVYLHVQNVDILRAPNPLDNLELCSNNYLQCASNFVLFQQSNISFTSPLVGICALFYHLAIEML